MSDGQAYVIGQRAGLMGEDAARSMPEAVRIEQRGTAYRMGHVAGAQIRASAQAKGLIS